MAEFYGIGGYGEGGYGTGDPTPVFSETVEYYINLLIIQYFNRARSRATVGIVAEQAVADEIIDQVREGFDLDNAVGEQLDILASYRGAVRTVFGLDLTRDYFAMPYYDDDPEDYVGFAEYGDVVTWYFLLYASGNHPVYAMTDDELRRLTKFRAKAQSRFLSVSEIDDILWEFFGANVSMTDNLDMTITYTHDPADTDTLFEIVEGTDSLPQPAGVEAIIA